MKESEFIQLLNLYLDHEISAAEAARLEAEVQTNPARRKVYQQYCRMQKACKLLTADFQGETAGAVAAVEKKILAFNPAAAAVAAERRKKVGALYTFGGLAAAACVAFLFVNREPQTEGSNSAATMAAKTADVAPVQAQPEPQQVANHVGGRRMLGNQTRMQPKLVSDPLLLTASTQSDTLAQAVNEANERLKWIETMQLAPMQQVVPVADLRFNERPTTLRPEARVLGGNRAPTEVSVEMTAFQFAK